MNNLGNAVLIVQSNIVYEGFRSSDSDRIFQEIVLLDTAEFLTSGTIRTKLANLICGVDTIYMVGDINEDLYGILDDPDADSELYIITASNYDIKPSKKCHLMRTDPDKEIDKFLSEIESSCDLKGLVARVYDSPNDIKNQLVPIMINEYSIGIYSSSEQTFNKRDTSTYLLEKSSKSGINFDFCMCIDINNFTIQLNTISDDVDLERFAKSINGIVEYIGNPTEAVVLLDPETFQRYVKTYLDKRKPLVYTKAELESFEKKEVTEDPPVPTKPNEFEFNPEEDFTSNPHSNDNVDYETLKYNMLFSILNNMASQLPTKSLLTEAFDQLSNEIAVNMLEATKDGELDDMIDYVTREGHQIIEEIFEEA